MTSILVRGLSEETHRALKVRARKNGRSVNAEMCAVLDSAVQPAERVGLGTAIVEMKKKYAQELGLKDFEEVDFDALRDKTPARYVDFSGPEFDRPESE